MNFTTIEQNCDETTRLIREDTQRGLEKTRDEVLAKIRKQQVLLTILKKMNLRKIDLPDKENLEKSVKKLSFQDFLQLEEGSYLLDLCDAKAVGLSYTERKAVRNYVIANIPKVCQPAIEFVQSQSEELPIGEGHARILQLEEKRRQLQLQLAEIKSKKCSLLKKCADYKMGPYLRNELKLMHAEYKMNQTKANALLTFLSNELLSRTEHTVKAIKVVEGYIDAKLEEEVEA